MGKEQRQGLASTNNQVSPGDYVPNYGAIEPHAKEGAFGKSQRKPPTNVSEGVGPGAYNWDKGTKKGGYAKFGKQERVVFSHNDVQGPGAYNVNQNDLGKNAKNGWTIQKRYFPIK
jgi:hypothetical protein